MVSWPRLSRMAGPRLISTSSQSSARFALAQVAGVVGSDIVETTKGYHATVENYKRQLLQDTLERTGGNQSKAADALDLPRTYLSRLLKNMGLR